MAKANYTNMRPMEVYKLVVEHKIKKFPLNYLDQDIIKEILRHVILKNYKFTRQEIIEKVTCTFLRDNCMGGFYKFFGCSVPTMLIYSFPEHKLKRWEFKKCSNGFWKDKSNQKEFIVWIAKKEGLDLNKKEDIQKISAEMVMKYGGSKPLVHSGGLYELVNSAISGKFKEWELYKSRAWTEEKVKEATKWLIEEKLKLTPKQVCNLKTEDFYANDLGGMLHNCCNHSVLRALEITYPGMYERHGDRGIKLKS